MLELESSPVNVEVESKAESERSDKELESGTPLNPRSGSNFCTHKLIRTSNKELQFQPTWMSRIFSSMFVLGGIGLGIAGIGAYVAQGKLGSLGMAVAGVIFAVVGVWLNLVTAAPRICDLYRRELILPRSEFGLSKEQQKIRFTDIDHLQIIEKLVTGSKGRKYKCYELNVVRKVGERVAITDHADYRSTLADAELLSRQIGGGCRVVVWNMAS